MSDEHSPETAMEQDAEMRADAIAHGYARFSGGTQLATTREALERLLLPWTRSESGAAAITDAILSSGVLRDADNPPAMDREALWRVVEQHYGEHPESFVRSILSSGVLRDADEVRREALAPIRADYTHDLEVAHQEGRAEGCHEGWRNGQAELRAAIEALAEQLADLEEDASAAENAAADADDGPGMRSATSARMAYGEAAVKVRALLVDDGAAALREVRAKATAELRAKMQAIAHTPPTDCFHAQEIRRALRDTAVEAGE